MTNRDIQAHILALRGAIQAREGSPIGPAAVIYDSAFTLLEGFLCNVARIAEATERTGTLTNDRQTRDKYMGRW